VLPECGVGNLKVAQLNLSGGDGGRILIGLFQTALCFDPINLCMQSYVVLMIDVYLCVSDLEFLFRSHKNILPSLTPNTRKFFQT